MLDAPWSTTSVVWARRIGKIIGVGAGLAALAYIPLDGRLPHTSAAALALALLPGSAIIAGALMALLSAAAGAALLFCVALALPFLKPGDVAGTLISLVALLAAGLIFAGHYLALSRVIDSVNAFIGRWLSWLVVAAVLVSAINAIVRKVFDTSSNAFLELQWVMFSIVFLLCAPWTLRDNEHIRIDIINQMLALRARRIIDLAGHVLFLMPFALLMILYGIPFFWASYAVNEQSFSAGGLPQWPAKSLVAIGFALLAIQGVSEIIKRIASMRGLIAEPHPLRGQPKSKSRLPWRAWNRLAARHEMPPGNQSSHVRRRRRCLN